jgi:hypothetical protein
MSEDFELMCLLVIINSTFITSDKMCQSKHSNIVVF